MPLLLATVVLVIEIVSVLLGMALGLDLVELIETLGLEELVDFGASEAGESLLGESVGDRLAWIWILVRNKKRKNKKGRRE